MNLFDSICAEIQQNGPLPFVDFMHRALYAPNLGYYSSTGLPFGAEGDFITAPMLTPLFAGTLAHQCQELFLKLTDPIVFEFGAGTGQLCVDMLTHLEKLQILPREYHMLEVSAHLMQQQRALIQSKIPHLADRIRWLSHWPNKPFQGVVIANEVLDAMPVHRFLHTINGLFESHITLNADHALEEIVKPCTNERLRAHVQSVLPRDLCPYQSEVNLFVDDWLQQCGAMLQKGAMIVIDYGFPEHEFYHPDRYMGTLMCHYQHKAHTNPLIHLGEQDITAHVDFTHVAHAGVSAGFHVAGYTQQAAFLQALGLLDLLSHIDDEHQRIKATQAVKTLIQPTEMGELFKVMLLTKDIDGPFLGFQSHDKRASL
ncbi:MAG: SAM-dependent methyltransferase [Legionellales bacterium]|nr:SAM-dependent methyltransferase [Legionellales bacterium]